jgi:hypothetical protein
MRTRGAGRPSHRPTCSRASTGPIDLREYAELSFGPKRRRPGRPPRQSYGAFASADHIGAWLVSSDSHSHAVFGAKSKTGEVEKGRSASWRRWKIVWRPFTSLGPRSARPVITRSPHTNSPDAPLFVCGDLVITDGWNASKTDGTASNDLPAPLARISPLLPFPRFSLGSEVSVTVAVVRILPTAYNDNE